MNSPSCTVTDSQCKKLKKVELVQLALKCKLVKNKSKGNSMKKNQLCDLLKSPNKSPKKSPNKSPPRSSDSPSPSKLTVVQLKAKAKIMKCKGYSGMKKAELVRFVRVCNKSPVSVHRSPASVHRSPASVRRSPRQAPLSPMIKDMLGFAIHCEDMLENPSVFNKMTVGKFLDHVHGKFKNIDRSLKDALDSLRPYEQKYVNKPLLVNLLDLVNKQSPIDKALLKKESLARLRERAKEMGCKNYGNANKDELINMIRNGCRGIYDQPMPLYTVLQK